MWTKSAMKMTRRTLMILFLSAIIVYSGGEGSSRDETDITSLVDTGYIEWRGLQFYEDFAGDYADEWTKWGKSLKFDDGWTFRLEDYTMGFSWKFTLMLPRKVGFTKITGRQYNSKQCKVTHVFEPMSLIPHARKLKQRGPQAWSHLEKDAIGNELNINMTTKTEGKDGSRHVPVKALEITRKQYDWGYLRGEEYTKTPYTYKNYNAIPSLQKKKAYMKIVKDYCKEYETVD